MCVKLRDKFDCSFLQNANTSQLEHFPLRGNQGLTLSFEFTDQGGGGKINFIKCSSYPITPSYAVFELPGFLDCCYLTGPAEPGNFYSCLQLCLSFQASKPHPSHYK